MTNPIIGQGASISFTNGRVHQAVITGVVSGTTVNLIIGNDDPTVQWDDPSQSPGSVPWLPLTGVTKGASLGQWQDAVTPDPVLSAIAAVALSTGVSESTPTRALNANFTPSSTRPVLCIYTGTWSGSLSVTGSLAGVLELRSDTSATPTTKRIDAQPGLNMTLSVGVTVGATIPWTLTYLCPINHNVRLVSSGTGTFALTGQTETVL
jgi:hypothetical protein